MYKKTGTILDKICEEKIKQIGSLNLLRFSKTKTDKGKFCNALKKGGLSLIAEIKKSSPNHKGKYINKNFNFKKILKIYNESNCVNAISVITEKKFFLGSLNYFKFVKKNSKKPILRKDFIIHPFQVIESACLKADAILLIAAILKQKQLNDLYNLSISLGLDVMVEVHNKNELNSALKLKPKIIGINNRDLKTMKVDINNFVKLSKDIPKNIIKISESGINNRKDILKLKKAGADAILVGTCLIESDNIDQKIKQLMIQT
ncbi:MAG: indole-3-glycerol phosphate synthase [Candidatus Moranbacteria bacterium]|nr:indole-3-glycerol phosphate synthase [Candidatus Moranbacteria bacterium]